jgi:hypothetical protein
MSVEFVEVSFEDDDDDLQLEANDCQPVDINDPRLTEEVVWCDPQADAYAKFAILRVATEGGLPAIRVQW